MYNTFISSLISFMFVHPGLRVYLSCSGSTTRMQLLTISLLVASTLAQGEDPCPPNPNSPSCDDPLKKPFASSHARGILIANKMKETVTSATRWEWMFPLRLTLICLQPGVSRSARSPGMLRALKMCAGSTRSR